MTDRTDDPDAVMAQAWRANQASDNRPATQAGGDDGTAQPATANSAAASPSTEYADAWHGHKSLLDTASDNWNDFKKQHPFAGLVLGSLLGTNEVTSAVELNDAYNHHDKAGMALAATGLVPGGKLVGRGIDAIRTGEAIQKTARTTLTGAAAYSAAKSAGQALKQKGAAQLAAGGGAEAANAGSNLADYIHSWNTDAQ